MRKRLIAKRKLSNRCMYCGKNFIKGDVYYKERHIEVQDYIYAYNLYICPKCIYKKDKHKKRFEAFKKICMHPQEFIETEWMYIPGECVKEPNYRYCKLCGKTL